MGITVSGGGRGNSSERLRRVATASHRYFLLVTQLGKDIFSRFPADTARILLASGTSLVCQVLAVTVLFAYLNALENNELLLGYPPRASLVLFALVATVTTLLFVVFALLEYNSNVAILRVCRSYQNLGTQEAMSLSSRLPHWFSSDGRQQISTNHIRQILSVDVQHRSRMARILMRAIIPLVRLIFCAAALFYINAQFSVLIIVVVGIPVIGLYSVGRKIADTITLRENKSQPVFREQHELLLSSWDSNTHLAPQSIDWELAMGQPESRQRLYYRRLKAKALGELLIRAANTLGILMLVLSLGFWVQQEEQGNWSVWLTYLIALRYFLSSLTKVARSLVQSTRFSRQVRRFMEFLAAAQLALDSAHPEASACPVHVAEAYKNNAGSVDDDDDEE